MSRVQSFSIGMVMFALGVAAMVHVTPIDHVLRLVSVMAVGTLSIIGSLVFFLFTFSEHR
jgi:hypothetical protein